MQLDSTVNFMWPHKNMRVRDPDMETMRRRLKLKKLYLRLSELSFNKVDSAVSNRYVHNNLH